MANSFEPVNGLPPAVAAMVTPNNFYTLLTGDDLEFFEPVSRPLNGEEVQSNFLELGKAAYDLGGRVQTMEAWPHLAGDPQSGYVRYSGLLDIEGAIYGGMPYVKVGGAIPLPVNNATLNYSMAAGAGIDSNIFHELSITTGTVTTTAALVTDLNKSLKSINVNNGSTREFAITSASISTGYHGTSNAFDITFDDDETTTQTITITDPDGTYSAANLQAYLTSAFNAANITDRITATLVSSAIKLSGNRVNCSRITLRENGGTFLATVFGWVIPPTGLVIYDFTYVLEFLENPAAADTLLLRGINKSDSYRLVGGASPYNMFTQVGFTSPGSLATESVAHTQRPTSAYSGTSVNIGGTVYATDFVASTSITTPNLTVTGDFSVANLIASGDGTIGGNVTLGGTLASTETTFNLVDTTVTTLNIGGAATTVDVGAATGTTSIKNNLDVTGTSTLHGAVTTSANLVVTTSLTIGTTLSVGTTATIGYVALTGMTNTAGVFYKGGSSHPNNTSLNDADIANFNGRFRSNSLAIYGLAGGGQRDIAVDNSGIVGPTASDARLKTNIHDISYGLSEVTKLRPVFFNWKEEVKGLEREVGFIAQEVRNIVPEIVRGVEAEDSYLSLNYSKLAAVLVKAIQELNNKVEALEHVYLVSGAAKT